MPDVFSVPEIYTLPQIQRAIILQPQRWRPLVLTNGCFDVLHAGHVRYLRAAQQLGRSLIVGLNSDASVRQIKPAAPNQPPRPIVPERQRAEVLAALKPVDAVVIFSEPTATTLVQSLQPDCYVKGGDYTLASLPEAEAVAAYGGHIQLIPIDLPTSTSQIIERILQVE